MNNLSDFANFGEVQIWGGGRGAPGRGAPKTLATPLLVESYCRIHISIHIVRPTNLRILVWKIQRVA